MDNWVRWAVGLAWAAGVGVAGYAIAQESRITALEERQKQGVVERTDLKSSTTQLANVITELNTSVRLLKNEIEIRREYETVAAEAEEEPQ